MTNERVYVDNELFLGRLDEQDRFRQRQQADQQVAQALEREVGESRYAALRDLDAGGLAKLVLCQW